MRRFSILVFLLLALSAALSTALATSYPLTVTDDLGRKVTLDHAPQRIVSMIPSSTETVCAEGACGRLVGVDQYSDYPASVQKLPHLGNGFDPNIEALVALKPDLVLADESSTQLVDKLAALGIPTYAGTAQTLDGVYQSFETIGELIDEQAPAAVLSGRVQGAVDAVQNMLAGLPRTTVYYELDTTPYSAGPTSFIGQLLTRAGGANIVPASKGQFPQLDPEFIVQHDPAVIILADAPNAAARQAITARPGWRDLAAVKAHRVIALTQTQIDELSRPGPRIPQAVELLAHILHPAAFPR